MLYLKYKALLGKVWVNGKKSALARYLLWVNTTEEERKGKCREKKKPTIFPFPPLLRKGSGKTTQEKGVFPEGKNIPPNFSSNGFTRIFVVFRETPTR